MGEEGLKEKAVILDAQAMRRMLTRIAHEIVERNKGTGDLIIVGIRRRGVPLARRIQAKIKDFENTEVPLTSLEFRLLLALYDRKGRVQSRALLLDDVWGIQASIETRTVDTHVKRLREKLGAARDYIETVRGVGYRFTGSEEEVPS